MGVKIGNLSWHVLSFLIRTNSPKVLVYNFICERMMIIFVILVGEKFFQKFGVILISITSLMCSSL